MLVVIFADYSCRLDSTDNIVLLIAYSLTRFTTYCVELEISLESPFIVLYPLRTIAILMIFILLNSSPRTLDINDHLSGFNVGKL